MAEITVTEDEAEDLEEGAAHEAAVHEGAAGVHEENAAAAADEAGAAAALAAGAVDAVAQARDEAAGYAAEIGRAHV